MGTGRRREPRKAIEAQVRIFGTDTNGRVFSERAVTVNVSHRGAELSDVLPQLNLDEIIGLSYGNNRVHFRVRWVGKPRTPKAGHVGLLNLPRKSPSGIFPYLLPRPTITSLNSLRGGRSLAPSAIIRWNSCPRGNLLLGNDRGSQRRWMLHRNGNPIASAYQRESRYLDRRNQVLGGRRSRLQHSWARNRCEVH